MSLDVQTWETGGRQFQTVTGIISTDEELALATRAGLGWLTSWRPPAPFESFHGIVSMDHPLMIGSWVTWTVEIT